MHVECWGICKHDIHQLKGSFFRNIRRNNTDEKDIINCIEEFVAGDAWHSGLLPDTKGKCEGENYVLFCVVYVLDCICIM